MLVHLSADRDGARFLKIILARPWRTASLSLALALFAFTAFHRDVLESLARYTVDKGLWAFTRDEPVYDVFAQVAGNLWFGSDALPVVGIDIRFENHKKLNQKRIAAVKRGLLIAEEGDYVSATLNFNGEKVPVKLRLKGDWLEHVSEDKPSYRVHVRGGSHFLGLRRFSIQHPQTRGFQSEALFLRTLRHFDILAPRYFFVEFHENGANKGVMAIEEHFSKELLESQGRRESVILKFDESRYWASWSEGVDLNQSIANDYRIAPVAAFQYGKIVKAESLYKNYLAAVGLLRSFQAQKLRASDVFDAELMGRFIAVADVFGTWHTLRWHNQRFYFNPITGKLEPIGFDASLQDKSESDGIYRMSSDMISDLLQDEKIWQHYELTLRSIPTLLQQDGLLAELQDQDEKLFRQLSREFFFLSPFPWERLRERARHLAQAERDAHHARAESKSTLNEKEASRYAAEWVNAYIVERDGKIALEVVPAVGFDMEIASVHWTDIVGAEGLTQSAIEPGLTPILVPGREFYSTPSSLFLDLLSPNSLESRRVSLVVRRKSDGVTKVVEAIAHVPARERPILPQSQIAEQLKIHEFLKFAQGRLLIRPGDWQVTDDIVVPAGVTLEAVEGTTLSFAPNAALIARGPVSFRGKKGQEIRLRDGVGQNNEGWPGLVILEAESPSYMSHVIIEGTRGIAREGWTLTGGTTFYRSDVNLEFTRFENHRGEDALNIVSSNFELKNVTIENTLSDGFDSDFSEGFVTASRFERIGSAGGGDAIDVSGSDIVVVDSVFENIADKAVSVGEGSTARISRSSMSHVGTGLASKDGSTLEAVDITIDNPRLAGAMAYIKKPEYGAARIEGSNIVVRGDVPVALAQTGSEILLDERSVAAEDLNVEELYQTVMKPGLRK